MKNLSAKETELDEQVSEIADAIDAFEAYETAHASRVARISDRLAHAFNLAPHDCLSLRQAALLHDIGEMAMNREYIKENRLLRAAERFDMQRHAIIGEQEAAKRGLNRAVQLLIRWHHEWWNGAGYPDALEQEQIPLAARILRVADTYASMTANRPYRAAVSEDEARKYLVEWSAVEFDARIVKAFLALETVSESEKSSAEKIENQIEQAEEETVIFQTQF